MTLFHSFVNLFNEIWLIIGQLDSQICYHIKSVTMCLYG